MSKIRVGIVTCGIRKLKMKADDVYIDKERKGAAHGRNFLIRKFLKEGAEHIFIFDDDTYPVLDMWKEKIMGWAALNDVHYLAGLDYKNISLLGAFGDTVISQSPYLGAFCYIDRECVEKCGLFDEGYRKYGFEDVEYAMRAHHFGMTGKRGYYSPLWINMYIHSMDMFEDNPKPNMTQEEKSKYIELNSRKFEEDSRKWI